MSEVQTLARGLQILELLADSDAGLATSDFIDKLDYEKSSVSRLMKTLVKYRFVDRDPQTRRYFLGNHLREMSRRGGRYARLRELAEPHLQEIGTLTAENAHLAVYSPPHALTIADVPSTEPLRVVSEVGRRMPLHCSAVGKCLLAFSDLPIPLENAKYTGRTITDVDHLKLQLEEIRLQIYALDDEELTLGVRGLAMPVRNREGRSIAAVGLSGPSVRLTYDAIPEFVELLQKAATAVSQQLGYVQKN